MRKFYDAEAQEIITEKQLEKEFMALLGAGNIEPMTFAQYIRECTGRNGTLTEI